jgi:hypothetical protein
MGRGARWEAEMTTDRDLPPGADVPPTHGPAAGAALALELAALRARLREVEAALGLPVRPGQQAPPPLASLVRRVAALERRAGIVPGLVPLPGCGPVAVAEPAAGPPEAPRARRRGWRDRRQVLLAGVLLVALVAWLRLLATGDRPTGRPADPAPAAPTALTAALAVPARVVGTTPAGPGAEDGVSSGTPARQVASPGATPCPLTPTAPCAAPGPSEPASTAVPSSPTTCVFSNDRGEPGEGCADPSPDGRTAP